MNDRNQSNALGCVLAVIIALAFLLYAINNSPDQPAEIPLQHN